MALQIWQKMIWPLIPRSFHPTQLRSPAASRSLRMVSSMVPAIIEGSLGYRNRPYDSCEPTKDWSHGPAEYSQKGGGRIIDNPMRSCQSNAMYNSISRVNSTAHRGQKTGRGVEFALITVCQSTRRVAAPRSARKLSGAASLHDFGEGC